MPDPNPGLMTVFTEALELTDSAARAAYLDRACGGDAVLRARVEALLAAHAGAGRFLEPALAGGPDPGRTPPGRPPRVRRRPTCRRGAETGTHHPGGARGTLGGTPPSGRGPGSAAGRVVAGRYTLVELIGEGAWGRCTSPSRPSRSGGRWR